MGGNDGYNYVMEVDRAHSTAGIRAGGGRGGHAGMHHPPLTLASTKANSSSVNSRAPCRFWIRGARPSLCKNILSHKCAAHRDELSEVVLE